MAMEKKCDRCGKWYEHYPTGNKSQYNAIRRIQRNGIGNTINSSYAIDLCPECMGEFEKFMTAKLLEEKNAEN